MPALIAIAKFLGYGLILAGCVTAACVVLGRWM
jgi:hypothetical protein